MKVVEEEIGSKYSRTVSVSFFLIIILRNCFLLSPSISNFQTSLSEFRLGWSRLIFWLIPYK